MSHFYTIEHRVEAEITEKKSRFIAHLAPVTTEDEALDFLEEIRTLHRMARHNVYAYIICTEGQTERIRYSDDGEPQKTAGLPALHTLQHTHLSNVAVVITRYFGGTLLGTGGLVRAYTQATQAALEAASIVSISRCVDLTVEVSYPLYDQVLYMAQHHNAKLIDTTYTNLVTLHLRMLDGTQQPFCDALGNLCHGKEYITLSEPFDAAF